jgi:hypothetical protein
MIAFYFDEHVPGPVVRGLRARGVSVLTVQENGRLATDDVLLIRRATELGRLFVTQDDGVLAAVARLQRSGEFFSGVVYAKQRDVTVGDLVRDLELLAKAAEAHELENGVTHLPI